MDRSKVVPALACLGAVASCGGNAGKDAAQSPNVVVIMTDDQGYDDFSAHGNPLVRTPNLDAFRAQSVRLTDFHSAPMSTATRGQLMTGIDALRNGADNVSSGRTFLDLGCRTMAQIFSEAGYRTAIFGKWHLGDTFPYRPEDRGFDETLWYPSSHIGSIPDFWGNDYFDDVYIHNGIPERQDGYCTDVFFSKAADWAGRCIDAGEPFMLYLSPNAPHGPFNAPDSCVAAVRSRMADPEALGIRSNRLADLAVYVAMIESVDHNVGRFLAMLDGKGASDNTIVIFMTDNGSVLDSYVPSPSRRGKKGQMLEGGHRVPFFLRYPAAVEGGRDVGGLAEVQDVLPTLMDFCGIGKPSGPGFDGISLAGALKEEEAIPEDRTICVNYSNMPTMFAYPSPYGQARLRLGSTAVLWRNWRLLEGRFLYDLESDPMEKKDVSAENPGIVRKMTGAALKWWDSLPASIEDGGFTWVGDPSSPSVTLTACEWVNVFTDQQSQVLKGTRRNSYTMLDVRTDGTYRFELRRWPRELDLPLRSSPEGGRVCDVALAKIYLAPLEDGAAVQPMSGRRAVTDKDTAASFEFALAAGRYALHTWFDDSDKEPLFGAYYVYVDKILENN